MTYVVAAIIAIAILGVGVWIVQFLATPPPPEPDPDEVVDVELDFRCAECGLKLTVTQAQDAELRPPRHCREPMDLIEA